MKCSQLPALAGFILAGSLHAATVRIEGGMVAVHNFVAPHRVTVEQSAGQQLEVTGTTGTKGLMALSRGECELAVTAISLELMVAELAKAGHALSAADFREHFVADDRLVFVVHPALGVSRLSPQQLDGLYSGKIVNWREVGGPDLAVRIFTDPDDSGTSALLRTAVLKGQPIGGNRTVVSNLRLVSNNVSSTTGAIGAVSTSIMDPTATRPVETEKIARPLLFITKGEPSPEVRQVIEAYRRAATK